MGALMTNPWPDGEATLMALVAEHEELRSVVRQVLAKHADHESVRVAAASDVGYSTQLWRLLNDELEIAGLAVPEALGGSGFGMREMAVVLEEAGAALLPEPLLTSAVLGTQSLAAADEPAHVAGLLAEVIGGTATITVADLGAATLQLVEGAGGLEVT